MGAGSDSAYLDLWAESNTTLSLDAPASIAFNEPFMSIPDLSGPSTNYSPSQSEAHSVSPPEPRSSHNPLSDNGTPPYSISPVDSSLTPPLSTSSSMPTKTNSKDKVAKRTLNTLAARRYRQKRVDQMNGLEAVLKETETERDDLKVRVARLEGELEALKALLKR